MLRIIYLGKTNSIATAIHIQSTAYLTDDVVKLLANKAKFIEERSWHLDTVSMTKSDWQSLVDCMTDMFLSVGTGNISPVLSRAVTEPTDGTMYCVEKPFNTSILPCNLYAQADAEFFFASDVFWNKHPEEHMRVAMASVTNHKIKVFNNLAQAMQWYANLPEEILDQSIVRAAVGSHCDEFIAE